MRIIEALETLDEYDDSDYSAYLEYTELKDRCMIEPSTLYIHESHEFLSQFKYCSIERRNKDMLGIISGLFNFTFFAVMLYMLINLAIF